MSTHAQPWPEGVPHPHYGPGYIPTPPVPEGWDPPSAAFQGIPGQALPPLPDSAYPPGAQPLPPYTHPDLDRIKPARPTITLGEQSGVGGAYALLYTLESVSAMERKYGGLQGMSAAFSGVLDDAEDGEQRAALSTLSELIAFGLRHVRVVHPDTGQRIRLGMHPDLVAEGLEVVDLPALMPAVMAAFKASFGAGVGGPQDAPASAEGNAPTPSRGAFGGGSTPSFADAPSASSGA